MNIFFISKIEKFFSSKSKCYKPIYIGYLFKGNRYLGKKKLFIENGNIENFSFLEIKKFSFIKGVDYGIFIKDNDFKVTKEGNIDNYASIIAFYGDEFIPNPGQSNTKEDVILSKNKNLEILKMAYPYGLPDNGPWGDKWDEEYQKKYLNCDMESDSDLTDYDSDGNYIYEDNSNPTNSGYFNKSDLDFLNNN